MQRVLFGIVAAVVASDCVWASFRRFDIDIGAYAKLLALSAGLVAAALFYERVRKSAHISAMLSATAFLIAFSASFSMLNYFLLTVPHTRIDALLARADLILGFDWTSTMVSIGNHLLANTILHVAYISVLPQVSLLIVILGWKEDVNAIYGFCVAFALAAVTTVGFWAVFPSFGAFSIYELDPALSARLDLALDATYAHDLVRLLADGPGRIAPNDVKGLVGFPSFHAAMALLVAWYARTIHYIRWPVLILNMGVLIATPIHGGHHIVDVFGGVAVALGAVAAVGWIARAVSPALSSGATASRVTIPAAAMQ